MGRWKTGTWVASGVISACLALLQGACGPSSAPPSTGATLRPAPVDSSDPYARLQAQLASLRVSGKVATSTGLLLPERIRIEVRSEICVETRRPGARFWAMDFDTCFVYSAIDTVDSTGMYQVSVPCIDADRDYEASTPRMDYRLVPRGPVTFLAESDAGWRHQETFTSSRNQRRDLKLTLHTETFFVVHDQAAI
ncbi:MAG: hypothetical protein QGH59_03155, partial [Gemmatimonadota bacterium]|nr:hypothetical protein [Gemmatimonadota bacterium]